MAKVRTVWGIDIGQRALKALRLRAADGELEVEAFDIVEHPQILSQPDADSQQLIRAALEQFLSRNSVAGCTVCVSVPGQSSFTRFVKLPPVEPKKIPDIVRFEAEQQIPFAISEVIWRWQTFHDADSPDVEVGIFAMKRTDIAEVLDHFSAVGIDVDIVQMAPLALFNFMAYDEQASEDGATLLADVGADKTDLVVSDGPRIWTRTIQIGGNNFTEAVVKAFKLSFAKAEKLKRTAASSKYARQIFQAMRPVFADLVQEIQRSVGYYTSLHREARFKRLIGLGNGFRLPGLQKFLEQNLGMQVVRIDSYKKLRPAGSVNTPVFTDNVLSFAVSYGLALQGLGQAAVETNLLPSQIVRARQWARKRPWFAGVAATILAILAVHLFHNYRDRSQMSASQDLNRASAIANELKTVQNEYGKWVTQGQQEMKQAAEIFDLYRYRDYWPRLQVLISKGIAAQAIHQQLLTQYALAQTKEDRQRALDKISSIPRSSRRMFFLEKMETTYRDDVGQAGSSAAGSGVTGGGRRGFEIRITGRTPLTQTAANPFLRAIFRTWQNLAQTDAFPSVSVVDYGVVDFLGSAASGGGLRAGRAAPGRYAGKAMGGGKYGPARGGPSGKYGPGTATPARDFGAPPAAGQEQQKPVAQLPDPLFPDNANEDMAKDTRFLIKLVVSIDEPASAEESTGG